jgi:tryptophanyl-tRNA synthetase
MRAFTGGRETVAVQKKLGGNPTICNIYAYYHFLFESDDAKLNETETECRNGALMCGDCKARLARMVNVFLVDFQKKREAARTVLNDYWIK